MENGIWHAGAGGNPGTMPGGYKGHSPPGRNRSHRHKKGIPQPVSFPVCPACRSIVVLLQ